MSEMEKITISRALYLQEDKDYRTLITEHQKFYDLILNENSSIDEIENVVGALKMSLIKFQTNLQNSYLIREAKAQDEKEYSEKIKKIENETAKRTNSMKILNLELEQAKIDSKKMRNLSPIIENALLYPSRQQLENEMKETKEKFQIMETMKRANEEFFKKKKQASLELFSILEKMV